MMAIWTPYPNVRENLLVLNDSHLADVVWQGLDCLRGIGTNLSEGTAYNDRHVRMWTERPAALMFYVLAAEAELRRRGVGEEPRVIKTAVWYDRLGIPLAPVPPWWYGDPKFHVRQRSHLIRCDPEWYARRFPLTTPLNMELWWPKERKFDEGSDNVGLQRGRRQSGEREAPRRSLDAVARRRFGSRHQTS